MINFELTGTSALIYLPQKKAKMILEASHAIACFSL
jgi:hypothetical protein